MAQEFVIRDTITPVLKIEYERSYNVEVEKLRNRFTLAELLAQKPERYMGVQFTCKAALTEIHDGLEWFYKACDQCRKKLQRRGNTLACEDHKVMTPKNLYLFTANMADDTAAAKATFFDSSGASLLQTDCNTMINQLGYTDPHVLPVPLTNVQGRTKIFQMRFSISSRRGAIDFVVDRVFEDGMIPQVQPHPEIECATSTSMGTTSASIADPVKSDPITPAPTTPALTTVSSSITPAPTTPALTTVSSSTYSPTKRPRKSSAKKTLFEKAETSMDSLKKQKSTESTTGQNTQKDVSTGSIPGP